MPRRTTGDKPKVLSTLHASSADNRGTDPKASRWESTGGCQQCDIRQRALFAALSEPVLEHLLPSICSAVIPMGDAVYEEDEPASAVYTIGTGILKLVKRGPAGPRIVRLLGPGTAAGLEALSSGSYRHTAVALRPTELCRIPAEVVQQLQGHDGQLADEVLGQWEQQLESADRWLAELGQGTVAERLLRLMAILLEMEERESPLVQLPPMADVASILGITRESVSRALADLQREKALRRVAPHTYELPPETLH